MEFGKWYNYLYGMIYYYKEHSWPLYKTPFLHDNPLPTRLWVKVSGKNVDRLLMHVHILDDHVTPSVS